ncbi:MAG: hypothetical protein JJT94_04670 [Bernardetiaceae bacterium]|nr:hypothetical protein [Bernardetiaceae bacterium]
MYKLSVVIPTQSGFRCSLIIIFLSLWIGLSSATAPRAIHKEKSAAPSFQKSKKELHLEHKIQKIEQKLERKKRKAERKGDVHAAAKVGFVIGLLSVVSFFVAFSYPAFFLISFLLAIAGLIVSIIGIRKTTKGKGWAIAGIISSILGLLGAGFLVFVILVIAGAF